MIAQSIKDSVEPLKEKMYSEITELQIEAWVSKEPLPHSHRMTGEYKRLSIGESWGNELFDCAWFRFSCSVPEEYKGKKLYALLDVNGEMLVVDSSGNPLEGLTNQCSTFDESLGKPGKISFELTDSSANEVEIWADAGLNDLFGMIKEEGRIAKASLVTRNETMYQLWYDLSFLLSLAETLDPESQEYKLLEADINKAVSILENDNNETIESSIALLKPHIYNYSEESGRDSNFKISAIGHSHLDLAWLWPVRETIRKGARTFATALRSMERFPDYTFGASQPQLYAWMKEHYPHLYKRVKEKVAEGRWDIQGGLWVECDMNLVSSESIIRQLLYGIRFFQKEFGIRINNLMLPDAFGFTAALPQIMSQAGIDYFVTMKPAWNMINRFPYHSFIWKGVDGSEIPSHILPEGTYNGSGRAASMKMIHDQYSEKKISDHSLMLFGIGDGGGGPGLDHLESINRIKENRNLPAVKQERVNSFYSQWIKQKDNFPVWHDEIYLEKHQGTFTSQGKIKKMNRKMEQALQKCELLSVVSHLLEGPDKLAADREKVERIWKEVLLYQFHDILPGSSIKRVYEEAMPRYRALLDELDTHSAEKLRVIAKHMNLEDGVSPSLYFNYTNHKRDQWISCNESWTKISLPPMGIRIIDDAVEGELAFSENKAEKDKLENDLIALTFSEEGWISSIFDKEADREILSHSGKGNLLSIYQDDGDCWDFPLDYRDKRLGSAKLDVTSIQSSGPYVSVKQVYSFGSSRIEQEIRLTAGSKRIDFSTKADWRDEAKMLRVSFDVDIHSRTARYEIPGAFIERPTHSNTSWDKAKDEVPAHRWADLSQRDRGVALLNDSKYGYRIKDKTMELTLLRSAEYPQAFISSAGKVGKADAYTDLEEHEFTYSLFPHRGDDLQDVIREAACLNSSVERYSLNEIAHGPGLLNDDFSFFSTDNEAVVIQSVKMAEDDDSVIIRLHESQGGDAECLLSSFRKPAGASSCDLIEETGENIPLTDGKVSLNFKPFQIVTVKLEFK